MILRYGASATIILQLFMNEFSVYAISSMLYFRKSSTAWPHRRVIAFWYWFFLKHFFECFMNMDWKERQQKRLKGISFFFFFFQGGKCAALNKILTSSPPWSERMRGWEGGEALPRLRSPVEDWGLRVVVTGSLKPLTQPDHQPLKSNSSQKWT